MATVSIIASSTEAVAEQKLVVDSSTSDSPNYDTMAKALLEPDNRGVQITNGLVKVVSDIKSMYQTLTFTFIAFDDAGVLDEHGNPLRLASQWRKFYEVREREVRIMSRLTSVPSGS